MVTKSPRAHRSRVEPFAAVSCPGGLVARARSNGGVPTIWTSTMRPHAPAFMDRHYKSTKYIYGLGEVLCILRFDRESIYYCVPSMP